MSEIRPTPRGTGHACERIEFVDAATGALVTQMTNASVPSRAFYFETPSFNTTNDTMFFFSQRTGTRGAPWDLYRVDGNGDNIVQLSDEDYPLGDPCPAPDDPRAIYGTRGNAVMRLDIDTCEEIEIGRCDGISSLSGGTMDGAGRYYFSIGTPSDGPQDRRTGDTLIVRFRTDGSEVVSFGRNLARAHLTCNHSGTILHYRHAWSGDSALAVCDIDGENHRPIGFQQFAHRMWLGTSDRLQGPMTPPGHGIVQIGIDETEPTAVCAGPYFWHAGASADGEWVVADTNWPDQGIMLVHVESGRFAPVVKPRQASGSGQATHPHPSFDRSGGRVVYTSNATGLSQVCVAEIPDALRHELETGELSKRRSFRR